jgi:hypothetical protein
MAGSVTGSLAASLLATLTRPGSWAMGLAGFLVRGGILLVLLPIVRLPTTAGLANDLGPTIVGFVFGGPSAEFLVLAGTIVALTLAWLVAGGLLGAALDLSLIRAAVGDEELDDVPRPGSGDPPRAFAARVVAHLPTAAVLAWGAVRLVEATYQELIRPGDPGIPVALRVALRVPDVVVALIGTWVLGEALGGLAVRHLAWGHGLRRALSGAIRSLARPTALGTMLITNGALAAAILALTTAAGAAWNNLRIVLLDGGKPGEVGLALAFFSLVWVAGLWLLSIATAWRATAWTFEVARRLPVRTLERPPG